MAIAQKFDCKIHIAHAYSAFHSGFQTEEANEKDRLQAQTEAEQELENFLQKLDTNQQPHVSSSVFQGDLLTAIAHWTNEQQVDLIIAGIKGAATGFTQKLIGSQSFNMAKTASLPVIVVPLETEYFKFEQIALFTNYNENDTETLKKLENLFGSVESMYRLIHIQESSDQPSNSDLKSLEEWASMLEQKTGIRNLTWELAYGEESAVLVNDIAARSNIDLLVMGVEDENFFERFFDHNLTKEVIRQSKTPVLLMRSYD